MVNPPPIVSSKSMQYIILAILFTTLPSHAFIQNVARSIGSPVSSQSGLQHPFRPNGAQQQDLLMSNDTNEDRNNCDPDTEMKEKALVANRRQVLAATASAILSASTAPVMDKANAISFPSPLNFGTQGSSPEFSTSVSGYKPAKRATAYFVDSTIPPTLVPFRTSREAAVLKQIGSGSGTQKTPYTEDVINLNNFMKKSVFGTIDAISSITNPTQAKKTGPTFCFLALPEFTNNNAPSDNTYDTIDTSNQDVQLAESIMTDLLKPRRSTLTSETAIGLSFIPKLSGQPILNQYLNDGDESQLIQQMETESKINPNIISNILPILKFAKSRGVPLLALGPEIQDLNTVRKQGLQDVDFERRSQYVIDTDGFISLTQDPKFRLYTDRSLLKDWIPLENMDSKQNTNQDINAKIDGPGDFFAQRILEDETIATSIAQWAVLRPNSFVVVISDIPHCRYFGGANGRLPRIMKYLNAASNVDNESITTILLNPTAKNTLSLSRFLRLEIGTAPENLAYQTKVADYLWFSNIPKVNMLPRLMRGA